MVENNNSNTIENGNAVAVISNMNEKPVNENTETTVENGNAVLVHYEEIENRDFEVIDAEATVTVTETENVAPAFAIIKRPSEGQSVNQQTAINELEEYPERFLLTFKTDGTIKRINDLPLAIMFQKSRSLAYVLDEEPQGFYEYHPETGLWKNTEEVELEKEITDFAVDYFLRIGRKDAYFMLPRMIGVVQHLKTRTAAREFFDHPILDQDSKAKYWFHCANGVLEFSEDGGLELKPFSPNYRSRFRCEQRYNPQAPNPKRFLKNLINKALDKADRNTLQLYAGQCVLGKNISQTFLVVKGRSGRGKSTIVNVIQQIIGGDLCAPLRIEHSNGRFEIGQLMGKSLLMGCDVPSNYLNTEKCNLVKSLTGKDTLKVEFKGRNETRNIKGQFNLLITCNSTLFIQTDNGPDAWERRTLCICYNAEPPKKQQSDFDDSLVDEEGSGILNWMLEGACKLLRNGGKIPRQPEQVERIKAMLENSDPVRTFVEDYLEKDESSCLTNEELWNYFNKIRVQMDLDRIHHHKFLNSLLDAMEQIHQSSPRHDIRRGNSTKRGFAGVKIKELPSETSETAENSSAQQPTNF